MTTETLGISSNSFGFIIGGITLLGLIINLCRFHLPSNKIKVLESLLDDTETFFQKTLEEGLLIEPNFVRETERRLEILKRRTCDLQSTAYSVTTISQDYVELFKGTSMVIGTTCQSLKRLRAEIISSSKERRRILMEMTSVPESSAPVLPLNRETQVVNRPILPPAAEIDRPRSCPPSLTLAAVNSEDPQNIAATSNNPFHDRTQSDSDVQTTDAQESASAVYTSASLERTA